MVKNISLAIGLPAIFVATVVSSLVFIIETINPATKDPEVQVTTTVTSIDYDEVTGEIRGVLGPIPPDGIHEGNLHLFGESEGAIIVVTSIPR